MMRINFDIDDQLMQEAMQLTRFRTRKAMIETALKLLIQVRRLEESEGRPGKSANFVRQRKIEGEGPVISHDTGPR